MGDAFGAEDDDRFVHGYFEVIDAKIQELWGLSNGSFGRASEQALADFAGQAFLGTAIPSIQFQHAL